MRKTEQVPERPLCASEVVLLCEREKGPCQQKLGAPEGTVIPVGGGASSVPLRLNSSGEQKC